MKEGAPEATPELCPCRPKPYWAFASTARNHLATWENGALPGSGLVSLREVHKRWV